MCSVYLALSLFELFTAHANVFLTFSIRSTGNLYYSHECIAGCVNGRDRRDSRYPPRREQAMAFNAISAVIYERQPTLFLLIYV